MSRTKSNKPTLNHRTFTLKIHRLDDHVIHLEEKMGENIHVLEITKGKLGKNEFDSLTFILNSIQDHKSAQPHSSGFFKLEFSSYLTLPKDLKGCLELGLKRGYQFLVKSYTAFAIRIKFEDFEGMGEAKWPKGNADIFSDKG